MSDILLSSPAGGKCSEGGFNPVAELEKLRQAQQGRFRLEIDQTTHTCAQTQTHIKRYCGDIVRKYINCVILRRSSDIAQPHWKQTDI